MAGSILIWAIAGAVFALCVVLYRQWRAVSGTYRPLASRQPGRQDHTVPLGMEATDLDAVARTTRRNEALERSQTNWTRIRSGGFTATADTDIPPMPDDETYAARYHDAFQKDKTRNRTS